MEILRKQGEEEDCWNKYEGYSLESSSDKLECNEPSFNLPNFDKKEEEGKVIKNNRKKEGICKGLGDDEGRVLLESKKHTFKPV